MNARSFKYIYEVGNADVRGGLVELVDVYSTEVQVG
jgi:hypothetical protein